MTSSRLTGFLNDIVPMLCQVFGKLICYRGPMQLQRTGLWKLAVEALFYIVEDSLCALERCAGRACMVEADRFWDVLSSSFAKVVEVLATSDEDTSLLSQVCANLLMQRLLVCAKTPINIAERAVGLLQVLVRQSGMGSPSLRHFFALCETAQEEPIDGEDAKLSVVSATAKGVQAPVPRIPSREALLSIAAPALVEYVRNLFSCYLQEEEARQRGGSASSALHRVQEVRLALTHLRRLDADDAVVAVAAPNAEKAQMACKLAGKKGLVMALLPQLSALAPSGDPEVRKLVREVLQELAAHLELT
ncbi:Indole-3-acetate beta-glucosyltransferase [Durusdinium trenchii]|uniref:Indole-3-acetate beta-glucosyltransferase n=1 Tax=Durusdinium trenchii TaxID=1381693 RepID=A0ABP0M595_9DINO